MGFGMPPSPVSSESGSIFSSRPPSGEPASVCAPNAIVCRISVASDGTQGNETSNGGYISQDGRYILFRSTASNLVANDSNGHVDMFVHDRQTLQTTRVSVASDGTQSNAASEGGAISSDGRYVVFNSEADTLILGDTNATKDTFVHDRQTGQTTRVSVNSQGVEGMGPSSWGWGISTEGRFVAFTSFAELALNDSNATSDVFVYDRQLAQMRRVSNAYTGSYSNNRADFVALSNDGRYVAFTSTGSDIVPGDTNNVRDAFVHDRQTGQTTRVSVASNGTQGNGHIRDIALSSDGRYVVFSSEASNLVPGDTNARIDMFVHDRQTGQTTRVSVTSLGAQASAEPSGIAISADGRYIGFNSLASNLVPGDTNNVRDAFIHDRQTGRTVRVSVAADGAQGNQSSYLDSISADGRYVVIGTNASNLTPEDTNVAGDILTVEWQRLPLTTNGSFRDFINTGEGNWNVFASPNTAAVSRIQNGVFEFYRQPGSQQVVLIQNTGVALPSHTGLEVKLDLGNASPNRKRVSVLIHDSTFSDLQICSFWLPPNSPLQLYTMQGRTSQAWLNASLSIYANTADGEGWYQVDNAIMTQMLTPPPNTTLCSDPNAPTAPGGADGENLVVNGDFSTTIPDPTGDPMSNWWSFGGITWFQASGMLHVNRPVGSPPGGTMIRNTAVAVPAGMPLEATLQLGSSADTYRYVKVLIHDADFTDFGVCAFWLPPNATTGTYTMRMYTTETWDNATIAVYPNPAYPTGSIQVDDVTLRQRPSLALTGTQCYEPGAVIPAEITQLTDVPISEPEREMADVPHLLPPGELPLIATPVPLQPANVVDGEGEFTEGN